MEGLTDEELVEKYLAATGAPAGAAFVDRLFERHHKKVAAWCYRLTGETDSATDLAQEVFLKAYQHLESFRGGAKFTTWLYSIARNHCMDALRARARKQEDASDVPLDGVADDRAEGILTVLERRESETMVRQMMVDLLNETESKVMTLHYVQELPLASVTRLLGLSNPSGAKAFIVSARRKLTQALARKAGGPGIRGREYAE